MYLKNSLIFICIIILSSFLLWLQCGKETASEKNVNKKLLTCQKNIDQKKLQHCSTIINKHSNKIKKNTAKEYNNFGFALYKKKQVIEAAKIFECAIIKNKKFALAYYNLACMNSLLHSKEIRNRCIYKKDKIFMHLKKALSLQLSLRKNLIRDPDFEGMKKYVHYWQLYGLSLSKTEDVKKIVPYIKWQSGYRTGPGLLLKKDMTFEGSYFFEQDLTKRVASRHGNYSVHGNVITLRFAIGKTIKVKLRPDGNMQIINDVHPLPDGDRVLHDGPICGY